MDPKFEHDEPSHSPYSRGRPEYKPRELTERDYERMREEEKRVLDEIEKREDQEE